MNINLRISLFITACFLIASTLFILRKNKISIKYFLIWALVPLTLIILVIFPNLLANFAKIIGFETISNMLTGVFIVLLFLITMMLTMIVTHQKRQITLLIQEISILKETLNRNKEDKNKPNKKKREE